jgi:hypothetical protein
MSTRPALEGLGYYDDVVTLEGRFNVKFSVRVQGKTDSNHCLQKNMPTREIRFMIDDFYSKKFLF